MRDIEELKQGIAGAISSYLGEDEKRISKTTKDSIDIGVSLIAESVSSSILTHRDYTERLQGYTKRMWEFWCIVNDLEKEYREYCEAFYRALGKRRRSNISP